MSRGWVAWVPAAIWAAVLFYASSLPATGLELADGRDKLAHFSAYLVLGILLTLGAARRQLAPAVPILIGVIYGATDEFHQSFVPGRSVEVADWVADSLGTIAGVLLFILIRRIRDGWDDDLATHGVESTSR